MYAKSNLGVAAKILTCSAKENKRTATRKEIIFATPISMGHNNLPDTNFILLKCYTEYRV